MPQSPSPEIWQPMRPMAYDSMIAGATASSTGASGARFARQYTSPEIVPTMRPPKIVKPPRESSIAIGSAMNSRGCSSR